jgi:hypothetical protein
MALLRCDRCLEDKPIESFPDIGVSTICQVCISGEKAAKTEIALKEKAKQVAGALASMKPDQLNGSIGSVKSILSDLYGEFGGTSGYASYLHWVIVELSNRKPMPAAVGSLMVNLLKLHHTIEQTEESINAREMTEEQLRREQNLAMMRIAMEAMGDPEKRKALEEMLGKQGLVISEASPSDLIRKTAEAINQEDATEGNPTDKELEAFLQLE